MNWDQILNDQRRLASKTTSTNGKFMKSLFSILFAAALAVIGVNAQTPSTSTTTTTAQQGSSTTTSTTATESVGTISEFTPGSTLVLNTGTGEPVHYKLGTNV